MWSKICKMTLHNTKSTLMVWVLEALGTLTEHTTFDAKGVEILLGLQLIEWYMDNPNEKECLICLDGRSAIEALQNCHPKSGQSISEQVEQLATVMWILGHCGIVGNEAVNKEAKRAAEGDVSWRAELPTFLHSGDLPATASAIRQFTAIDEKGINSKFLENAGTFKRKQTSILFQLRTGHVSLKAHLHRLRKVDSPECPHCERLGRNERETVKHYILECPAYRRERFRLRQKLGRQARSIQHILSNGKAIPHLLRYIGGTERFQRVIGDLKIDDGRED
ncbi:hypothetical protein J3R30DRAFT_3484401 [Lentinula aciculospora]|uniref:RNase H type-1 domain-containing protein n=1 Tax=Lentinula aciculospora TaxID=153920 RepID=A0A9W9DNF3_9AGAR|nr:hypothetical protein J3R30DRAFT_3484401 [Lentinula aciculospora]